MIEVLIGDLGKATKFLVLLIPLERVLTQFEHTHRMVRKGGLSHRRTWL